jgi:hypothetical protein
MIFFTAAIYKKADPVRLDGSLSAEIPGPRLVGLAGLVRMGAFRRKNQEPRRVGLTGRMNQSRP